MSLQKKTLHALMGGTVICEISDPELYRFLHEDGGLDDIAPFVSALGCKLAMTGSNKGLFLAWQDGSAEAERAVRASARDMQEEADKLLTCMSFMLEVDDSNGPLAMGDLVRAAAIAQAIDGNAALRDSLATLAAVMRVNAAADHGRISDILRKLKDMGYLKLVNKDREEYLVTGKIDRINDILTHYHAHIGALRDISEAGGEQGSLF